MQRRTLVSCLAAVSLVGNWRTALAQAGETWRSFMARAFEMRREAEAAGDQPYGAVVVKDRAIGAESPSRVVTARNPDAHAEREAIRLAQARLGSQALTGCVLVSSSRPCGLCEKAAHDAGVARMIYGERLTDGGPPRA